MTRIPGYLDPVPIPGVPARPHVDVELLMQATSVIATIPFLIDTGADDTVLQPFDLTWPEASPIASTFDDHPERRRIEGIGGSVYIVPVSVRLFFRIEDGPDRLWYDCRVWVAEPTDADLAMPSLLGRDLLQFFRLTLDYEAALPVLLERS
ncbi:MAG: hypothetical protein OXG38_10300 [Chloroflexi bacterium]|nr:hypothetical protein [Chloroflexota bacterium]